MPVPMPLMNLPIYNMGTSVDSAIKSQPAACGRVARAIAARLPQHSAVVPAKNAPTGFDTTPNEAIHEASEIVANWLSRNFGTRTALKPCDRPTEIWPE